MGAEQEESDNAWVVFFKNFLEQEEVVQGFAHFFLIDCDVSVVHPVAGKFLAVCGLALCDFTLVVREFKV